MNGSKIALLKLQGVLPLTMQDHLDNSQEVMSLNAEFMRLGYIMSKDLFYALSKMTINDLNKKIVQHTIPAMKEIKGADVVYEPMYPNFPRQVMEMDECELYGNALMHYWMMGTWKPQYDKLPREFALENTKFKEVALITEEQFMGIFTTIVSANESLSVQDISIVEWYMNTYIRLPFPNSIPFKENLCILVGRAIQNKKGMWLKDLLKTPTDVLRVVTYMCGGDISLAANTKFDSFPRGTRRMIVQALENCINEEDIQRHRNKWKRLFHNLHVGEHKNAPKTNLIANKLRAGKTLRTVNGQVQRHIDAGEHLQASQLLTKRPGEFARRLDHLLRITPELQQRYVVQDFLSVADKVSTRVLLQVSGHFKNRCEPEPTQRIVFPKGAVQRAQVIPAFENALPAKTVQMVMKGLGDTLLARFSALDPLGKVFVDPLLKGCPIPAQQRSASASADTVARGTRFPMGASDKGTLRLAIYWVGRDVDLSATFHNEEFKNIGHISWTNLTNQEIGACASGDITSAPNGAAEFIDVPIEQALKAGVRYVAMNVLSYSHIPFNRIETCYVAWMFRDSPNAGEIFDPKTVQGKLDLNMDSKHCIPVLFDLKTREVVWADLVPNMVKDNTRWGSVTVEGTKASIEQTLEAMFNLGNKPTLEELALLHATSRGSLVDTPEEADFIFGMEGDVTPRDISVIHGEYLV